MKPYRSIDNKPIPGVYIYAFDKIDGSNIRAEWDRKKGFHKFGTRTRLVDSTDPIFKEVPFLVTSKYGEAMSKIFTDLRLNDVTVYFEFYGPNSRFGVHEAEKHEVTLIDVNLYKKGFINPKDFLKWFEGLDKARLLYTGKADQSFRDAVSESRLDGMTYEGVVCKTGSINPEMFKIKSKAWYAALLEHCKGDMEAFKRLS